MSDFTPNGDINLRDDLSITNGVSIESAEFFLDTSYAYDGNEISGSFYWNSDEGTADIKLNSNVSLQLGQELTVMCKNQTGADITNGTPVMFAGAINLTPSYINLNVTYLGKV